jgi:hypothetical protein
MLLAGYIAIKWRQRRRLLLDKVDPLQLQRNAADAKCGGSAAGVKWVQARSSSPDGTRLVK